MKDVIICGDIHGSWDHLNNIINKKKPKELWCCGDFGIWPNFDGMKLGKNKKWKWNGIKNKETKIRFCDGNHEDHPFILSLENPEVMPNVFYQKRGSVIHLNDGRTVLFMGGADSIDKGLRTPGHDWFSEEIITQKNIYTLPEENIDIVISHTCPIEFLPFIGIKDFAKVNDPSCKALSYVLKKYHPRQWFFGHWHVSMKGFTYNCSWECLNMSTHFGWWKWLK